MVRLAHLVNRVHDLECLREDDQGEDLVRDLAGEYIAAWQMPQ